jgi:hypothetical protein
MIINFKIPLTEEQFNSFVEKAFEPNNPFMLLGNPIKLGKTKVHIYGMTKLVSLPINIEITEKQVVVIMTKEDERVFDKFILDVKKYVSKDIEIFI